MADTSIEWTDATWNPVAGCTVISPGLHELLRDADGGAADAMGMKKYRGLTRKSGKRAVWTGKVRLDHDALGIPAGWKKPRRIFVNSMSDLFHEAVPAEFVAAVWRAMQATPQHTYQILTKRPDRMADITASLPVLPNVWLGTSVESADYLGRIDDLRKVNAAVRFVSFEPLIGLCGCGRSDAASIGRSSAARAARDRGRWPSSGSTEIESRMSQVQDGVFFQAVGRRRKKTTGRHYRGRTFDEMPHEVLL